MGLVSSSSYFTYGSAGTGKITPEEAIRLQQSQKQKDENQKPKQQEEKQQKSPSKSAKASNVLPLLADGQFEVGCADIMLAGTADGPGVFARIFYPTTLALHDPETASTAADSSSGANKSDASTKEYMSWKPDPEYVEGLAKYRGMSVVKLNFFLDWIVGHKKIPVYWRTPVFPGEERFPVVVFSHGISGNRFIYTTLCASVASHGYVVAALEHRDGSCCYAFSLEKQADGELVRRPVEMIKLPHTEEEYETRIKQVNIRVDETIRMCDIFAKLDATGLDESSLEQILLGQDFNWAQFKDRLDLATAVSIGHSFGGASALAACARGRFARCVVLDGWLYPLERHLYASIGQPVLMLSASKWQWTRNVRRLMDLQGTDNKKHMFTIKDIVHQSYSDFGFLYPGMVGRYFGVQGDLDPLITGNAIMELIAVFLRDPTGGSGAELRSLVAQKYSAFILEGTDIPREELDKVAETGDAAEATEATREEEERKVARDADVADTDTDSGEQDGEKSEQDTQSQ